MKNTQPSTRYRHQLMGAVLLGGALTVSGCAATHVGDSWQCPLAQGRDCVSVAAADPAVTERPGPETRNAGGGPAIRAPLYRARSGPQPGTETERPRTGQSCAGGCGPFTWLAGLFKGKRAGAANPDGPIRHGDGPDLPVTDNTAAGGGGDNGDGEGPETRGPAAPPPRDGLRTGEVIGRIWIGPFADADGIYHEGHWIRVVLAPAGWRLP